MPTLSVKALPVVSHGGRHGPLLVLAIGMIRPSGIRARRVYPQGHGLEGRRAPVFILRVFLSKAQPHRASRSTGGSRDGGGWMLLRNAPAGWYLERSDE